MLLLLLALVAGCSRPFYRKQADSEVRGLVAEKSNDPRWEFPHFTIAQNRQARYFDPTDPDYSPIPKDDPASHEFMHCVDGMKGWPLWHCNGDRCELENPEWRAYLSDYVELTDAGAIKLPLDGAVQLALVNSPDYRQQIETIYLSALDVSTERFRFETQFFGSNTTAFAHKGQDRPPTGEANALLVDTGATIRRHFATGADLLVGFANSFVWQFAGPDTNATTSLINFSLVQPLLRAGGRAVALEQLTIVERALLANLRAFQRYRQGFYVNIAVGDPNVPGAQRRGGFFGGTGLTGFTGQGSGGFGGVGQATGFGGGANTGGGGGGSGTGFAGGGAGTVGGFVGLLQQLQQVRNTRANLNAELRTLGLLEANLAAGLIDIAQVDQFRQSIETERANLLQAQNNLRNSLDTFKTVTMGLPPDLKIALDDSMIRQFQFIDPQTTVMQNQVEDFIDMLGNLPTEPSASELKSAATVLGELAGKVDQLFKMITDDVRQLDASVPAREKVMDTGQITNFASDRQKLAEGFEELRELRDTLEGRLNVLQEGIDAQKAAAAAEDLVSLSTRYLNLVQGLSLVQARARVESVTLDRVELEPEKAIAIARANRLDWMNNRASLVDTWRLIVFNANALQANVDITFSGDLGTVGNNPVNFQGTNGTLRASMRIDGPFTRLVERNNYCSALISYQQSRRQLIQYQDGVYQLLRRQIRQLDQLGQNLEIQRRAVVIAVRRVDQTREVLNAPPEPVQPGQPAAQLGPTAAQNLLTALSDLRNSQNNFMSVWLNYYATRLTLMRDLGVMEIDENGLYVDKPLDSAVALEPSECPLPPSVPAQWLDAAGVKPEDLKPATKPTDADEDIE